jgi:hypothetical protein
MDQEFWSERNRIYVVRMVQAIAAIIPKSMAFPRQAGMEHRPVANQNMRERTSIKTGIVNNNINRGRPVRLIFARLSQKQLPPANRRQL